MERRDDSSHRKLCRVVQGKTGRKQNSTSDEIRLVQIGKAQNAMNMITTNPSPNEVPCCAPSQQSLEQFLSSKLAPSGCLVKR